MGQIQTYAPCIFLLILAMCVRNIHASTIKQSEDTSCERLYDNVCVTSDQYTFLSGRASSCGDCDYGYCEFEDMCLSKNQYTELFGGETDDQEVQAGIAPVGSGKWNYPVNRNELYFGTGSVPPGAVGVPTKIIKSGFSPAEIENIEWGMKEIEKSTCIRFLDATRKSYTNRIQMRKHPRSCNSLVGMSPRPQTINLSNKCWRDGKGVPIHEFFHALGWSHEHNRHDRHDYIKATGPGCTTNVNFRAYKKNNVIDFSQKYDYCSILHYELGNYGICKLSMNHGKEVNCKVNGKRVNVGQRSGLSDTDILEINQRYCKNTNTELSETIILVIGGIDAGLRDVELISLQGSSIITNKCGSVPKFPESISQAGGVATPTHTFICQWTSCYLQKDKNKWWDMAPEMGEGKNGFGMAYTDEGIVVVGGNGDTIKAKKTGEIYKHKHWTSISNCPVAIKQHCVVQISSNEVMAIGGYQNGQKSSATWVYNAITDEWKSGPALKYERSSFSCATVKDVNHNYVNVIVAGGYRDEKSVEVLSISSNKWVEGPNLPKGIYGSTLVASDPHDASVIAYLIAGHDVDDKLSDIYSLSRNMQSWKLVGNLKKKRSDHISLSVTHLYPECLSLKG